MARDGQTAELRWLRGLLARYERRSLPRPELWTPWPKAAVSLTAWDKRT